jgi:hypothetical protein
LPIITIGNVSFLWCFNIQAFLPFCWKKANDS